MTDAIRKPIIRRLSDADAAAFRAQRLGALRQHPDIYTAGPEDWDHPLEEIVTRIIGAHMLGAFDRAGGLLGHLVLPTHLPSYEKTRHKIEIWSVYVAPEARGQGVGRALMESAIMLARELGYGVVKLSVTTDNKAARALYESLGFQAYGIEEDHRRLPDGRRIDEVLMQLRFLP